MDNLKLDSKAIEVFTSELCKEFQIPIEFLKTPKIRDMRREESYARLVKALQEGLQI